MNKPRKYNGVYKLPIHKHTPKRRPMSMYIIYTSGKNLCFDPAGSVLQLVTDISIGLENPLYVGSDFMEAIRNPKITSTYPERIPGTKPSLLTRVKERFKR